MEIMNEEQENPNALKTLMGFIDNQNIAEDLDEDELRLIGQKAIEGFEEDKQSMDEWTNLVNEGRKLVKQEKHFKDTPFENAANFKSPILSNAQLRFGDRASIALLGAWEIMKTRVVGKDVNNVKTDAGERVEAFMNWQLNDDMVEWRSNHDKLVYDLPGTGTLFKKVFYNAELGRNESDVIEFPNFVINNNAKSVQTAPRFSHILDISKNDVIEKQRIGLWLDIDLSSNDDDGTMDVDDDKGEQATEDKFSQYIEQYTLLDLDEDGYKEPYVVTIQLVSAKVVRIVARYNATAVFVTDKENNRSANLADLLGDDGKLPKAEGKRQIAFITPQNNIVKYGFLHDPQGGYLDVGYYHLLGTLTAGINTTTNQLLDAGKFSNLQGGFLAKGFRKKMGKLRTSPGHWQETDIPPSDLHNGMVPHLYKEPSATLFGLMQFMKGEAQELSASADIASAIGANTPAATTFALVQQQEQSASAIILRLYRAMSDEFRMLFKLNAEFVDEKQYQTVVDDAEANFREDFNIESMNVLPVANPNASSKIQLIQQSQVEMSVIPAVQEAGGNIQPIVQGFFKALGSTNVDEVFPEPTPEEEEKAQAAAEEKQGEQDALFETTMDHAERDQNNQDAKTKSEVEKNEATTIKTLEEAETESLKNLSDEYTAALKLDEQELKNKQLAQQVAQPQQQQLPINQP